MNLRDFSNDRLRALEILEQHQPDANTVGTCFRQQDLADEMHVSRPVALRLVNDLIRLGYVMPLPKKKGQYILTDDGLRVLVIFQHYDIE
jgi:Mn-dependent DtxR family transcriptional regulator